VQRAVYGVLSITTENSKCCFSHNGGLVAVLKNCPNVAIALHTTVSGGGEGNMVRLTLKPFRCHRFVADWSRFESMSLYNYKGMVINLYPQDLVSDR